MSLQTRASLASLMAALLLTLPAWAAPAAVRVAFTADVQRNLEARYGADEGDVLRADIVELVSRELATVNVPDGTVVSVTVSDVAPTRLTRKQQNDDPTLDPVQTKLLGGAELQGVVRDAAGRSLTEVRYRYFAPTLHAGSAVRDSWADARRAAQGFAQQVASACRQLAPEAT